MVMKPHVEQDGWVYIRVKRNILGRLYRSNKIVDWSDEDKDQTLELGVATNEFGEATHIEVGYSDEKKGSRVISSRRVEEAVEIADYLKKCEEENLRVTYVWGNWYVGHGLFQITSMHKQGDIKIETDKLYKGKTLREAYYWCVNSER